MSPKKKSSKKINAHLIKIENIKSSILENLNKDQDKVIDLNKIEDRLIETKNLIRKETMKENI